jgi:DNA-binding IclR family transcriptional regulator
MSVLAKASELIDCLGQAGEPVSLAFVRSALDMPKSSTHRLLGERRAGHRRRPRTAATAGPVCSTGEAAARVRSARRPSRPCHLAKGGQAFISCAITMGCVAPWAPELRHSSSSAPLSSRRAGRCSAFADDDVQRLEVRRAKGDAASFPNAPGARLAEELEAIRAERWATSVGERESGVAAAATPVFDSRRRVVAALCVSGPTTRLTSARLDGMRVPLERGAAEISDLLHRG